MYDAIHTRPPVEFNRGFLILKRLAAIVSQLFGVVISKVTYVTDNRLTNLIGILRRKKKHYQEV